MYFFFFFFCTSFGVSVPYCPYVPPLIPCIIDIILPFFDKLQSSFPRQSSSQKNVIFVILSARRRNKSIFSFLVLFARRTFTSFGDQTHNFPGIALRSCMRGASFSLTIVAWAVAWTLPVFGSISSPRVMTLRPRSSTTWAVAR